MTDETYEFDKMDAWRMINALGRFSREMDGDRSERAEEIKQALRKGVNAFGCVNIPLSDNDRELLRSACSHEYMTQWEDGYDASAAVMLDLSEKLKK